MGLEKLSFLLQPGPTLLPPALPCGPRLLPHEYFPRALSTLITWSVDTAECDHFKASCDKSYGPCGLNRQCNVKLSVFYWQYSKQYQYKGLKYHYQQVFWILSWRSSSIIWYHHQDQHRSGPQLSFIIIYNNSNCTNLEYQSTAHTWNLRQLLFPHSYPFTPFLCQTIHQQESTMAQELGVGSWP